MPIKPELRWFYPIDWPQISHWVRFVRASSCRYLQSSAPVLAAEGQRPPTETLAHVSPLAWEHITLTGEYRWNQPDHPAHDP